MEAKEFVKNNIGGENDKKLTDKELNFCVDLMEDWTKMISRNIDRLMSSTTQNDAALLALVTAAYQAGQMNAAES